MDLLLMRQNTINMLLFTICQRLQFFMFSKICFKIGLTIWKSKVITFFELWCFYFSFECFHLLLKYQECKAAHLKFNTGTKYFWLGFTEELWMVFGWLTMTVCECVSCAIPSHQTPHQSCVLSHLHTLSLSRQEYWATNKYVFTVLNHLKLQKIKTFPSSVVCLQEGIIHKIDR